MPLSGSATIVTGAPAPGARAPLVAVIDDDRDIRLSLEEILGDAGYRTSAYADAAEALTALGTGERPELIVLDLRMPHMDGWTFRLKQRESPELRSVPVIALSADSSAQAAAIDADAYLPKPLHSATLLSTIERVLTGTERKRLLARSLEIERLRTLGMFVGSVAHEVSTPLTYTTGNLELARDDCDTLLDLCPRADSVTHKLLSRIAAARFGTDRISAIMRDLLAFARAEGRDDQSQRGDVAQAIDAALRLVELIARGKATLRKDITALPPVVGQTSRLAQVFVNLLVNAVQAIQEHPTGSDRISVSARVIEDEVWIEVADTGKGIAPEHLPHVFEAFFTTKRPGEGTGIGLSFCKQVVEGIGGSIEVQSELGKGTTFRVRLRIARLSEH